MPQKCRFLFRDDVLYIQVIEPGQNITITGLEGSLTPTTAELPLANAHADAFASAHWVNVTNFSHGPVHNGSVIYRRTATTLSLDQSAPAVAGVYTGNFITIGNETREITGYNVLREVTGRPLRASTLASQLRPWVPRA